MEFGVGIGALRRPITLWGYRSASKEWSKVASRGESVFEFVFCISILGMGNGEPYGDQRSRHHSFLVGKNLQEDMKPRELIMTKGRTRSLLLILCLCSASFAWNVGHMPATTTTTRRTLLGSAFTGGMAHLVLLPIQPALAKEDCYKDCYKNCRAIVPNDSSSYCEDNCRDYCSQPDRTDGLSGSVSAASGEVGILGGTFGTGTVVKGEDKPPAVSLPGLDFTSPQGRMMIKGNS